ncbi:MAG: type VI secretion system contractile sheath small subunit, partial [Verrucomicrobia bacterium]|nr:type VI secretion system contractile sheath small subunit [Verrucomicrobiota bacterium]
MPERYRSRLMLTYRTNITGTPIPQRLPFRLLVLGRFTNALTRRLGVLPDLEHRPIHSIDRNRAASGVRIDDFMKVNMPWTTLPKALATDINGKVTFGKLIADVGSDLDDQGTDVRVHGKAKFISRSADNGTATLTIDELRVTGTVKLKKDAATGVGLADTVIKLKVSGVGSADIVDDQTGAPPGKLIAYLDNVEVTVPVAAVDPIVPQEGTTPPKAGHYAITLKEPVTSAFDAKAQRALPLTTMASFSPDGVVANVPELRRLSVIRDSLAELQSSLRNNPLLRKAMHDVLPEFDDTADARRAKLVVLERIQQWARSRPIQYLIKIPEAPTPAADASPTPAP